MKKISIYLLLTTFYLLFTMMHCDDGKLFYDELTRVELDNFNNAAKEMVSAETSLPKDAYVIGVRCFGKRSWESQDNQIEMDEWNDIIFQNVHDEISIVCNSHFSEKHPIGSDVTALFTKSEKLLADGGYLYFLVLDEAPDAGIHSFKLVYRLIDSKGTIEGDTKPLEFK